MGMNSSAPRKRSNVYHPSKVQENFTTTGFSELVDAVKRAEEESGGQGFVTLKTLSKHLTWGSQIAPNNALGLQLLSATFKRAKRDEDEDTKTKDQINCNILNLYGMLYCHGDMEEKAKKLFWLLQKLHATKQCRIDVDFPALKPVFLKMCKLATTQEFEMTKDSVQVSYSQEEVAQLENAMEGVFEDWRADFFAGSEPLALTPFCAKFQHEQVDYKFIFDGVKLRQRIFAKAGVTVRHSC